LKFFAGLEAYGFAGRDIHFGARARISSDAGLARLHVENSKAAQLDAVAFRQRFLYRVENSFHRYFSFGFGDAGAGYDFRDDVELNHANLLKT
jgi:hypothetical protein